MGYLSSKLYCCQRRESNKVGACWEWRFREHASPQPLAKRGGCKSAGFLHPVVLRSDAGEKFQGDFGAVSKPGFPCRQAHVSGGVLRFSGGTETRLLRSMPPLPSPSSIQAHFAAAGVGNYLSVISQIGAKGEKNFSLNAGTEILFS